ncbi:MAG: bacterial Ig-like domain-containing protein, partial [Clostridia bacterium]|nr:bacterial Ig-like domain-containing protein [Clostridia bacterium]
TAYLKSPSTNHYVFDANHSKTGGYVNDVDPVTIYEVYTDGCCKFQYITSAGAYRTAYGKIEWFTWNEHKVNTNYPKNYTAYLKNPNTNHYVFNEAHSNTGGYVNDVDPVTIYEVYTDGCCKFQYITSAGAYRTAYGKIDWFEHTHSYTEHYEEAHPHKIFKKCYCGDWYYTGATKNISSCSLCNPAKYTVHYDSNGGTGAPADQTKTHNVDLTLSSTQPTRSATITLNPNGGSVSPTSKAVSYVFNGWNEEIGGTGANYTSGGTYQTNAAVTLYAQWQNPSAYTLPKPEKSGYICTGWNTKADGSGTAYAVGAKYTATKNVTLYAQWTEDTVSGIKVKSEPTKLTYFKGETLDTTGLVVAAIFVSDKIENVSSGFTCNPTTLNNVGTQNITVTYGGKSTSFDVTVKDDTLSSVAIKTKPSKITYYKGETLITSGLTLTATYASGKTQTVSSGFNCNPTTLNTVGTQKITVTYGGKTTSFDVTVKDDTLSSVAIRTLPTKLTYYKGETLNTSGLTLTSTYASGKTQTVSNGFNCSPTTLNTIGTQNITVTYSGQTTNFEVTVKNDTLSGVAIRTLPTKLTYYKGETLITSGLTLTATYASGKTQTVSSGFNYTPSVLNTAGTQEIAVSYNGKGTYFNVNVIEDYVVGIYVKTQPNKTVYYKGDTLDTLGLTIIAKYASGKEERVNSGFTCSPTKLNSTGTQTITVSYMGFTTDFEITVKPLTVTGIAIRTTPAKTDYYVGDALNTAGLTLTVFYDNGSQKAISSGFNCTPMTFSTVGTQTITVTYGGSIATFAVNVSAVPAASHTITFVVDGRTYSTAVYKTGEGIQLPTEPVKPGYKFRNWNPLVPASMPDEDITVEAVFNPIKYNAVFTADSTTVAVIPYTVETLSITEPAVPSKNGYNGKWSAYSLDEGGVTVYAVYTPKTFTVPVVADGRKIAETTYTYGDTELVNLPAVPEKAGYTGKWEYNLTSDGAQANAIYTAVTYYATFTADGRKVGERIPFTVETRSINEPDVPSKSGYTGRWNAYTLAANDITVTAVYELINTPAEPSGRPATVSIRNFRSTVTEDYKSTLTFTAVTSDIPEGATIHWIINGKDMGTGETYTVERATSDYNVQIKVVGADGSTVAESETETVKIRSGFLEMLIAFFRQLLGSLPENKQ